MTGVVVYFMLLSIRDNMAKLGNITTGVVQRITEKLPAGWQVLRASGKDPAGDVTLTIRTPRGRRGAVVLHSKLRLEPKEVDALVVQGHGLRRKMPVLIAAPFISTRTQERLKARGLGYADLTGNIHLSLPEPGILIETTGAEQNPFPVPRERKSLKGAKAGRLIRALCDFRPPIGIREVAQRAGIDAGYASRLIDFLNREALVAREGRGPIRSADWAGLIHVWSKQYSAFERERARWYLSPRGIPRILEQIKGLPMRYAVSGSWAAAQFAPVSPSRLLLCYTDDLSEVSDMLDLRPTEAGANIALATPFDPVVYERTSQKEGIIVPAVSQIAADLLTSPGRGPNEAEALMNWMRENEDAWRT